MQDVNSKKILFIVTQSEMGGAQRFVADASVWLAQQNYQVIVAAGKGNGKLFDKLSGLKTYNLKHLKRMPNPLTGLRAVKEIRHLLKQEQPDILFLCSTMAGILGSIASASKKPMFGCPTPKHSMMRVIYRIGGWAFNDPRPWWQKKLILFLEKRTAKRKDKIIVNSQFDFDCALKHKIAPAEKLVKIHNGLDPNRIEFLPKEAAQQKLGLSLNLPTVGAISNFYKTKGLEYLIKAAKNINSSFIIIGDGPERKNLENLIAELNLQDKVILLGRIPEARKYLKAFDILTLPSLKEGFPWVILEAMAAGVPIVATKVGALPEIITDNQSGFLVEPGNSQALAQKIKTLLQNPALQTKFSQNARQRLQDFSQQKMLSQTEQVIKKKLDKKNLCARL